VTPNSVAWRERRKSMARPVPTITPISASSDVSRSSAERDAKAQLAAARRGACEEMVGPEHFPSVMRGL
jgi:hypothetical protein